MTIHEILTEWSYRLDRGYPEMDNPYDILVLEQILKDSDFNSKDINITVRNLQENVFGPKKEEEEEKTSEKTPDDEIEQLRTQLGSHSKKDLTDLIDQMDLDEKQIQKMYHRLSNFGSYKPILKSLRASNYKESEVKRYSNEIQNLIEDLDPKENTQFIEYLSNPEKQLDFPLKSEGSLFNIMPSDNVPVSVMKKIIAHTTQDEGKRGVGMGEMGMALVFKNITDSKGKGDLALNGEEFEIKGENATLGEKPDAFPVNMDKLEPFGLRKTQSGKGYDIGEGENMETVGAFNQFALALSKTYQETEDKEGFKEALKDTLTNDVGHGEATDALFDKIDFDNHETIQQEIALMNLYRYVNKEQFKHFLAHDFGAKGKNDGNYVYAGGSPQDIVDGLRGLAKFQKLSWNNCRPRIGFHPTYLEEEYV